MILVNKECNNCTDIKDLVWVPKDMVNVSVQCPICKKGTVTYESYFK